jgi:hypothetical protein
MPHVNILMLLVSSSKYSEALNAIPEHFEAWNANLQFSEAMVPKFMIVLMLRTPFLNTLRLRVPVSDGVN